MKLSGLTLLAFVSATFGAGVTPRDGQFKSGQPIDANGKGAPILGMRLINLNCLEIENILFGLALCNALIRSRWHRSSGRFGQSVEPWGAEYRRRYSAEPEVEILRFEDQNLQRWLGARASYSGPTAVSRYRCGSATSQEGCDSRASLA